MDIIILAHSAEITPSRSDCQFAAWLWSIQACPHGIVDRLILGLMLSGF